jgi:hypothetical protein
MNRPDIVITIERQRLPLQTTGNSVFFSFISILVTAPEKIAFKNRLKQAGLAIIEQRIHAAKIIIDNAQEAANNEEKSSAGDKYETARAMNQLEKEMHTKQLAQQMQELALLNAVKTDTVYAAVTTGACIDCGEIVFFVAAGLSRQTIAGRLVFFLSPQAPLAKQLQHKKAGDTFVFNGREIVIETVY